jgi:hypothetical protein
MELFICSLILEIIDLQLIIIDYKETDCQTKKWQSSV